MRRTAVSLALLGVLAACSPAASESAQPSASVVGPSPGAAADASCHQLDLLLQSGDPLDLTGSWVGDDLGHYEFRQFGDCLWFIGQNATYSYVFYGHLQQDFSIDGVWASPSASDHLIGSIVNPGRNWIGSGWLSLTIDTGAGPGNEDVVVRKVGFTNDPGFAPTYDIHVTTWTRLDDTPDHPFPLPSG